LNKNKIFASKVILKPIPIIKIKDRTFLFSKLWIEILLNDNIENEVVLFVKFLLRFKIN